MLFTKQASIHPSYFNSLDLLRLFGRGPGSNASDRVLSLLSSTILANIVSGTLDPIWFARKGSK